MGIRFLPEDDPEFQRLFGALSSGRFGVRNIERIEVGRLGSTSQDQDIRMVLAVYLVQDPDDRKTESDRPDSVLALPLQVAEHLRDALQHLLPE